MQQNQTYKLQGELVELRFLARAAELGLRVSKPYGDSAPYDFLVESGGTVYKVQVKSTGFRTPKCRGYVCATHRQGSRYSKKDVDFIAAYIVSEDAWYIIPLRAISGREVSLNPRFRPYPRFRSFPRFRCSRCGRHRASQCVRRSRRVRRRLRSRTQRGTSFG